MHFSSVPKKTPICDVDATGIDGCGCGCPWEVISGGDFEETCWQIWCIFSFDGFFYLYTKWSSPTQCSTSTHFAPKILKILFDFLCPFVAHDRETAVLRLFGKWKQKKKTRSAIVSSRELLVLLAKEKSLHESSMVGFSCDFCSWQRCLVMNPRYIPILSPFLNGNSYGFT